MASIYIIPPPPPFFSDTPVSSHLRQKDPFQTNTQSRAFGVIVSEHFIHIDAKQEFFFLSLSVSSSFVILEWCARDHRFYRKW